MYMPALARFTALDPMPPDGEPVLLLGASRYKYAENDPTNEADPSGLQAAKGGAAVNPCKVDVACARIGLPIGPKHCGVEVTDPSGTSQLHVRGTKGICDPLPGRVGLGWTGSYWIQQSSMHPQSVCDCIRDTAKLINARAIAYQAIPTTPCGGEKPNCNSNSTTYCLLAKCGVNTNINWGWTGGTPVGWGHRTTQCKKWHWVRTTPGSITAQAPICTCVCDDTAAIDVDWCA